MAALTDIDSKIFSAREFRLESGQTLPILELAYETYGTLSAKKDNAVLVVHGYTSSHHAAGRNAKGKQGRGVTEGAAGWLEALAGPDTKVGVVGAGALGLDLGGGDVLAADLEHVLGAAAVADPALLVEHAEVAGVEPAVTDALGGLRGIVVVALEHPGAAQGDLAALAG